MGAAGGTLSQRMTASSPNTATTPGTAQGLPTLQAEHIADYFGYSSHWASTQPGERVHFLDEGPRDGMPVILVHGSAIGITAAANFYLTIPPLVQAGYRVIAPDLYGYGFTEAPPARQAVRAHHVAQLCDLMDHLQLRQAYLMGNSLGGMVTAAMAIQHPQRVLGNIVIGTAGARWPHGSRFASQLTSRADAGAYEPALVLRSMRHLVNDPVFLPEKLVEFRTRLAERPGAYERHLESTRLREETKKQFPFDAPAAGQCQVPTLFIYGREDRVNPPEDALAAAEAFPHADMVLFGHCGHWTMVERADDFNALALRFLRGYDRRIVKAPVRSNNLRGADLIRESAALGV